MTKLIKGTNDLSTTTPKLAKEWHPTKNSISPTDITKFSSKKVWWICENGHEWQARVSARTYGNGCPYCSGRLPIKGENDLATTHPKIASEWHPSKNSISPTDTTKSSNKKVWWICEKGHEWQATVASRTSGKGCPYCSGKLPIKGKNDLATMYPEIASEWHPVKNKQLTPLDVKPKSSKSVWWMCVAGHEWKARIYSRVNGRGCPICAQRLQTSFGEQATYYYCKKIFPETINRYMLNGKNELDIFIPSQNVAIEYDGSHWHNGSPLSTEREKAKYSSCKKCGILLIRVREIESEADIFKTDSQSCDQIYYINSKQTKTMELAIQQILDFLSKCVPFQVNIENDRLHILENYYTELESKSLYELVPNLCNEWHKEKNGFLSPQMISPKSEEKVWWICERGHEWQARVSSRTRGTGCPYCSNRKVLPGFNDLSTINPKLAKEWHPTKNSISPTNTTKSSNKKVWWVCEKGHEWQATVNSRSSGRGCPYCSNKKVLIGFNDLSTTNPELAKEWHPTKNSFSPTDVTKSSNKKVWWICEKGHEWQVTVNSRSNGHRCPYCSNQKVLIGFNDLSTTNPELAKEWHPIKNSFSPTDVTKSSDKKAWWICEEGHEWQAVISSRSAGHHCPICGFKKSAKSRQKKIGQYSLSGEYLRSFESLNDASAYVNISPSAISKVCNGTSKTAGGFRWAILDD